MSRVHRTVVSLLTLAASLSLAAGPSLAVQRALPPAGAAMALQTAAPTGRIVVKFREDADLAVTGAGLVSSRSDEAARVSARLRAALPGARVERRFARPAAELDALRAAAERRGHGRLPDLNRYARVETGTTDRAALLAAVKALLADPAVETAFLEPVAVPAALGFDAFTGAAPDVGARPAGDAAAAGAGATALLSSGGAAAPREDTPDFTGLQGYLGAPPDGINAWAVNDTAGARGATVKVMDVEGAWLWDHEDLPGPWLELGEQYDSQGWRNHGTAVLGEIRGTDNAYGVRGITPDAQVGASSIGGQSVAEAILNAATAMEPGDVILIELHAPGPNATGEGQFGYVCMEFWQDNFDAIMTATALGVIVCEAAGNGAQDLDDPVYQGLFDRGVRDSGAIICGATSGASLEPASFTNYGSRVDLHGWGYDVVTCGYGWLQGDPLPETQWYTDGFSGTSSASPIVTGSVASLVGMVEARFGLSPDARLARDILVATGTPQEGTKHIGPRPDLLAAWNLASGGIGRIEGAVTDADTGLPVEGARVTVVETGAFDVTGAGGAYGFALLADGYTLRFESFFYATASLPATAASGATTTLDAALAPRATVDIAGRVFDEDGLPLVGVRVEAVTLPLAGGLTAGDGTFTLTDAPVDTTYQLRFDGLPGFGAGVQAVSTHGAAGSVAAHQGLYAALADFETDGGGFAADSVWAWGAPAAGGPAGGFSGDRCWGVGMDGDYLDDQTAHLESPVYNPTAAGDLFLSFHYWCDTEAGFDGVKVQTRPESGGDWTTRQPLTRYTDLSLGGLGYEGGWSGTSGGWQGAVFDLGDLAGQDFRFRLVFGSDAGVVGAGFWVDDVAFDTGLFLTDVGGASGAPAARAALDAYPNPFNPTTTLAWRLAGPATVDLIVVDARGRRVRALLAGERVEAAGSVTWDGRDDAGRRLASGLYLARLSGSGVEPVTRRLVLTK